MSDIKSKTRGPFLIILIGLAAGLFLSLKSVFIIEGPWQYDIGLGVLFGLVIHELMIGLTRVFYDKSIYLEQMVENLGSGYKGYGALAVTRGILAYLPILIVPIIVIGDGRTGWIARFGLSFVGSFVGSYVFELMRAKRFLVQLEPYIKWELMAESIKK